MEFEETGLPAVFVRGGTSKAIVFHARDLPAPESPGDTSAWVPILLAAMGSPDPSGRQLNGMGGGLSSLSKIAIVAPSAREDADVDYTFGQVAIGAENVGFRGNCGNISSAIGPFAVDEGLVPATGDTATVRIFNTNTGKIIVSRFPLVNGRAAVAGDTRLDGVSGSGARIELNFLEPGGAATGRLLPTGNSVDRLTLSDGREIAASLVDAANPVVFIAAESLGLSLTETPDALTADPVFMRAAEDIRQAAALAMGLVTTLDEARTTVTNLPLVGVVAPPVASTLLDGRPLPAEEVDISTRMVSAGQPHKAVPLTASMCLAVAANIPGCIVAEAVRRRPDAGGEIRIGHPSGVMSVASDVVERDGEVVAKHTTVFRTARRLMEGRVMVPTALLKKG